ncbi:hypothetical protein V0288_08110 [Pannus brasiliensis CCIBt3594]|uniref:Uncharacterized protein n=1 Tax=Pannus brasiliensis CCIBt3594 TaxID=1427578 RepID=A0AAW9QPE6_9CHRO
MSSNLFTRAGSALLLTLLIGSMSGNLPVLARSNYGRYSQNRVIVSQSVIPTGTTIPVSYPKADKILLSKTDVVPLTLIVNSNIRDRDGSVIIPAGSEVVGKLEPVGRGVQFIAEEVRISGNRSFPIDATSRVVTRTETIRKGANTQDILMGTAAGAGAAALIAGVTGDRRIEVLDVLAGAAVGTLAGWGLPTAGVLGGSSAQLYSVNPDRDLNLTLQSDLTLARNNDRGSSAYR